MNYAAYVQEALWSNILFTIHRYEAAAQLGVATALLCVIGYLCYLYDQTDRNPAVGNLCTYSSTHKKTPAIYNKRKNTFFITSPGAVVGKAGINY